MKIDGSTALVTGANRGIGRHLTTQLLARGATVYAGARNPDALDIPGARAVALDITDPVSVTKAAEVATDVTILINNAGSSTGTDLLGDIDNIRLEMDTHFFGTLSVTRAFVPVIAANGGGSIFNMLSVVSWLSRPASGAYCAAKSAEWSMTNALPRSTGRKEHSGPWTPRRLGGYRYGGALDGPQVRSGVDRQACSRRYRTGRVRDSRGLYEPAGAGRTRRRYSQFVSGIAVTTGF